MSVTIQHKGDIDIGMRVHIAEFIFTLINAEILTFYAAIPVNVLIKKEISSPAQSCTFEDSMKGIHLFNIN